MAGYTYSQVLEASTQYFEGDELAAKVFVDKYALQNNSGEYLERTPADMHRRLAKEFARIENKYPNPLSEEDIFSLLDHYKYIVPQGSPMFGIGNEHYVQSLGNCFVVESPYDSYGGILKTDQEMAQLMKRRAGVGTDIANIRPKDTPVKNAAKTTDGFGIFMERYSNTTREVAQKGRRGALMLSNSIKHPEIETFINIKRDSKKVTGANISVRVTDDFMRAVKKDSEFTLQWPVDSSSPRITKQIRAKDLWDQIIDSAWRSAEPGVLFWDTIISNSPADIYAQKYPNFKTQSTNPCIIGSTLVAVADGRNAVTIQELAEAKNDVPVYSTNISTGITEIKIGRNPRKTGEKVEVWKLTLDDGSVLIATPNHKILTKDLRYVELRDLVAGTSIYPFYSFNSNGYRQVSNTGAKMIGGAIRNRRQYRLIYEFNNPNQNIDPKEFAIHHKDFNSLNDSIGNLQVMTHEEHYKIHSEKMLGENNPYHKMNDEWKHNFASHPGDTNHKWINVSNEELIEHGKKLFEINGVITKRMWQSYAKENNLPVGLEAKARFGSFGNFKNQVSLNHKVSSVEFYGYEDVYNITVDDNHNYHIISSNEDNKYITSSGICVKNCGELPLGLDSCRLLVVNLLSFVNNPFTKKAEFDYEKFAEVTQKAQRLMDDLVDMEIEKIERLIAKIKSDPEPAAVKATELNLWTQFLQSCKQGRRTGTGITALGDCLAALNIKYGSKKSIELTGEIYRQLMINAYKSSFIMAGERGAFPIFDADLEKEHPFISHVLSQDDSLKKLYKKNGRRNVALLTTAPTGSVSTQTQTTSGIEPAFMLSYVRRKKHNPSDKEARVDFTDAMGDQWQEFTVYHHGVKKWMDVTGETDITKSPYYGATANEIDWVSSVDLQAIAQKYIDHSISKTCNLPEDVSKEVVSQVYMRAWEKGCKGFTVYRDKCRDGVLINASESKKDADGRPKEVPIVMAPKRPVELNCDVKKVKVSGEAWTIFVGLLHGRPYEVFGGLSKYVDIPNKYKTGKLVKNGKVNGISTYNFFTGEGDDQIIIKDVVNVFENTTFGAFTRTISLAIRHGAPIQYMVEQLQKDKHSDITSFSKVIARVLKSYITDGTLSTDKVCPTCSKENSMIYQEGCLKCVSCGWSKC